MAYKLIPSTFSEAGSSVKHMDTATAAEGLRLWNYLVNTYGMENPLAFDPTNKKQVKIARALQTEFTKAEIKKKLKISALKVDFGDGSRGNRGSGNQGNLFEQQLEAGINDWIETSELTNNKYRDFIYGLVKHYHLEDCIAVRVIAEGGVLHALFRGISSIESEVIFPPPPLRSGGAPYMAAVRAPIIKGS